MMDVIPFDPAFASSKTVAVQYKAGADAPIQTLVFPERASPFEVLDRMFQRLGGVAPGKKPSDNPVRQPTPTAVAVTSQGDAEAKPPAPPKREPVLFKDPPGDAERLPPPSPPPPTRQATPGGVRDTSMMAYRALQFSGRLSRQQQDVVDFLLQNPGSAFTRKEISVFLRMEINAVCGRVHELLQEPFNVLVEREEKKKCSITGNLVTCVELSREAK